MRLSNSLIAAGFLAAFVLSGCEEAAPPLAGSEWRPTELDGSAVPADAQMFVRFADDQRVEGNGGCNGFFGSYTLDGTSIAFGPLGATQMACPELEREQRFVKALQGAKTYARDGTALTLKNEAGDTTLTFVQVDAD